MRSGCRYCIMFIVLVALAACWACSAGKVAQCTGPEDNPRLHYVTGMDLIEKGDSRLRAPGSTAPFTASRTFRPPMTALPSSPPKRRLPPPTRRPGQQARSRWQNT